MVIEKFSSWSVRITLPEATGIDSMCNLLNYMTSLDNLGQYGSGYSLSDVVSLSVNYALREKDLTNLIRTRLISNTDVKHLYMSNDSVFSIPGINIDDLIFEPSARNFKFDKRTGDQLTSLIDEWNIKNKSDLISTILASVFTSIEHVSILLLRSFSALMLLGTGISFFQQKITTEDIKKYVIYDERPRIKFTDYEITSMKKIHKKFQEINTYEKFRNTLIRRTQSFTDRQKMVVEILNSLSSIEPKSYSPYTMNDLLMPAIFQEFSLEFGIKLLTLSLINVLDSQHPLNKPPNLSGVLDYFAIYKVRGNSTLDDGVSHIYNAFIHPRLTMEMNKLIETIR
jgi:hypothetical protein